MKSKEKKLLTWKEACSINHRAFSLIYKQYPKMIFSRLLCVVWDALTPYAGIWLSALIIGELAGNRDAAKLKELVFLSLALEAGISLAAAFLYQWRDTECAGMYFKVEQLFTKKLLDMDFISIDDTKTHELLSDIRQNQNGGGWGLYRVIGNYESLFSSVFTLLGGISLTAGLFISRVPEDAGAYTILNSPLLVLAVIAVMLAVTYLSPLLSTKAGSYYARNVSSHNLANRLFSFFRSLGYKRSCALDIRIYRQDLLCDKDDGKTGVFHSKGMFAMYARGPMGLYNAASAAVSVIFTGFAYIFVCMKAWAGAFDIGSVTQYIGALTRLSGSVSSFIGTAGDMRNNAAFLKQVFEFLNLPNTMYQGSLTVEKRMDGDYEIEFRNVSFQYPGSKAYALKNVSMKFRVGERLAVVGQNGSGKTTFIKLLCRLYDPTEGEILLNGIDIRKYDYLDYMSIFSVVFQDFQLFAFPLGQNVAVKMAYDRKLAEECLEKAGFGERLRQMGDGLDTYLYKDFSKQGVEISGGEAQKIALARALYKNAAFIVLDEPTAALDPVAEEEIYSRFNEIAGGRTAVYISHRLSSCRFCNNIAVFDHGQVVQQGSHEQLLAKKDGKYHELWYAQAQYYAQ